MTVREYLETYKSSTEIKVIGRCKDKDFNYIELYIGQVTPLLEIYKVTDILEKQNWGRI